MYVPHTRLHNLLRIRYPRDQKMRTTILNQVHGHMNLSLMIFVIYVVETMTARPQTGPLSPSCFRTNYISSYYHAIFGLFQDEKLFGRLPHCYNRIVSRQKQGVQFFALFSYYFEVIFVLVIEFLFHYRLVSRRF